MKFWVVESWGRGIVYNAALVGVDIDAEDAVFVGFVEGALGDLVVVGRHLAWA